MRLKPTYAEKALWRLLRNLEPGGSHFRRQVPFGPYVADFACHGARLIVETDGSIHDAPEIAAGDVKRDAWLTARGYTVLRFSNEQVLYEPEFVVQCVLAAVRADTPTPNPSPQGGGE